MVFTSEHHQSRHLGSTWRIQIAGKDDGAFRLEALTGRKLMSKLIKKHLSSHRFMIMNYASGFHMDHYYDSHSYPGDGGWNALLNMATGGHVTTIAAMTETTSFFVKAQLRTTPITNGSSMWYHPKGSFVESGFVLKPSPRGGTGAGQILFQYNRSAC